MKSKRPIVILMAEDDADDRLLTSDALEESRVVNDLKFVVDGVIYGLVTAATFAWLWPTA